LRSSIPDKLLHVTTYVLPSNLRAVLSRPLGDLVSGTEAECNRVLKEVIAKEHPVKLILVGDTISRNAVQAGIKADVIIIDRLEKRTKARKWVFKPKRAVRTTNLAGRIEAQARQAVEEAVHGEADLIEVEGEEDLLALVAVLSAPDGSLVVYGQPGEGIVLVRVSQTKKAEEQKILDQMERVE
jgi:hypothetical protein